MFQNKVGCSMPTTYDVVAWILLWAMKDLGLMFRWFKVDGYAANILELRTIHPGMLNFGDWVAQEKK